MDQAVHIINSWVLKRVDKKKKKVNIWFLGSSYRAERDSSLVLFWELFLQTLFSEYFSLPYLIGERNKLVLTSHNF